MSEKKQNRTKTGETRATVSGLRWLMDNRSSGPKSPKEVEELRKRNFGINPNHTKDQGKEFR